MKAASRAGVRCQACFLFLKRCGCLGLSRSKELRQLPSRVQATFKTQANALFRKNYATQKRNRKTNCCIVVSPILFLLILFLIQKAADSAIGGSRDAKVWRAHDTA